jgi:hypothetical protein
MKAQVVVYILLLLSPVTVCAQGGDQLVKGNNQAQSKLDALAAKLADGEIVRMEILQIPPRALTRTRVTPEMLEKQFHYKLTVRDIRGEVYYSKLVEVAKSIVIRPQSETADLRWGVIFYGVDESRVAAFYFDKGGSNGAVGDVPVSFRGEFFRWLEGNFSTCFR